MVFFFLNLCIYLERQNEAHMSRINKCDLLHLLDEDQLIHSYLLTGFPLRIHLLPLGGYFGELGANICLSDKKCIGSESWRVEWRQETSGRSTLVERHVPLCVFLAFQSSDVFTGFCKHNQLFIAQLWPPTWLELLDDVETDVRLVGKSYSYF